MHRQTDRQMDRQKQTDYNNPLLSSSVKNRERIMSTTIVIGRDAGSEDT